MEDKTVTYSVGGAGSGEHKKLSIRSGPRKPEVPMRCPSRSAKRTAPGLALASCSPRLQRPGPERRPGEGSVLFQHLFPPHVLSQETVVTVQRRNFIWNLYRRKRKGLFVRLGLGLWTYRGPLPPIYFLVSTSGARTDELPSSLRKKSVLKKK